MLVIDSKITKKIKIGLFSFCIALPYLVSPSWAGMVGVIKLNVSLRIRCNALGSYVLFEFSFGGLKKIKDILLNYMLL